MKSARVRSFCRVVAMGLAVTAVVTVSTASAQAKKAPAKKTGPDILLMQPMAPKTDDNQFEVMVKGADGKPISDADVSVVLVMPETATMAAMRNEVKLKSSGNGMDMGSGNAMMAGTGNATVSVKQGRKEIGQQKVIVSAK
jgi:hypothetical protein